MSLSDKARSVTRLAAIVAMFGAIAGCQVRPLYSEGATGAPAQKLASIEVSEAEDRVGQEVRNRLIFLVAGGAGEPANAEYKLALNVTRTVTGVLYETDEADTADAGRVTVTADYNLSRADTGQTVKSGNRRAVALVDFPDQEFAKLRAIRDAENRAARELAEIIRADLAAALGR
ncbi:LPS assembly lipoprotein LptE [Pararhizobium arenae]|uniref:LPS assembly lipoprotein LptE n=1 Tax=Pararhizobium arenae TaxID=1856850 RepID=UPI00094B126E